MLLHSLYSLHSLFYYILSLSREAFRLRSKRIIMTKKKKQKQKKNERKENLNYALQHKMRNITFI